MAQRVFLIQMPTTTLDGVAAAIVGSATQRRELAARLAEEGAAHLHRVTVSEMVAASCDARGTQDAWGYARNCLPYLLAATTAEQMCAAILTLEGLRTQAELEAFFLSQAQALGASPGALNRHTYSPPPPQRVSSWISGMLDRAAQLRSQALSHGDGGDEDARVGDYAVSTWVWLGRLFARLRPAFWQGRNRWLGGAAFPEVFNVQTNVMTVGATPPPAAPGPGVLLERFRGWLGSSARTTPTTLEEDVARMVAQTREATSQQSARARAPGLRELLESTATLTPVLAVPNWETSLPREGNGSCTSGAVQNARLDHLIAAARALQATNTVPYQNGSEWVELVVAAALEAKRTGSHLVEGDDSIFGAYRWPAVDES